MRYQLIRSHLRQINYNRYYTIIDTTTGRRSAWIRPEDSKTLRWDIDVANHIRVGGELNRMVFQCDHNEQMDEFLDKLAVMVELGS